MANSSTITGSILSHLHSTGPTHSALIAHLLKLLYVSNEQLENKRILVENLEAELKSIKNENNSNEKPTSSCENVANLQVIDAPQIRDKVSQKIL